MLQTMRERMQGIIAGAIIALICITFALWGIQYYIHGASGTDTVAKVGKAKITQDSLRSSYEQSRRQMGAKLAFDQESQKQLKNAVLDKMIQNTLLLQIADALGFYVGNQELQMVITSLPFFQVDGKFSPERFQEVMSNALYTEDSFLAETRNSLILMQLETGFKNSGFILPGEVDTGLKLDKQQRNISYVLIPKHQFLSEISISPADIKDYYQKHQKDFMTTESISIQYLQLSQNNMLNKVRDTTDADLQKFYRDNIDTYSTPKKFTVERILINLPKNATPDEISKAQLQLDSLLKQTKPESDLSKLSIGQFSTIKKTRAEMSLDFARELDKLQIGQISEPFRTSEGYNLVKITSVEPSMPISFSAVASKVKAAYTKQRLMQIWSQANDKLSDLTYTNSDSLEPAQKALDLDIKTTEVFTRSGSKSGILVNPKIVKAAFSDSVLLQGYNSNAIEIEPGNVIVFRIKDHNLAHVRPLAEVEPQIKQLLQEQMSAQKAKKLAEEIVSSPSKHQLSWQSILLARQDKRISKEIVDAAFAMSSNNIGAVTLVNLNNGDCAVIKLNSVISGDLKNVSSKERDAMQNTLIAKYGDYDYKSVISEFKKHIKIEKNNIVQQDQASQGQDL